MRWQRARSRDRRCRPDTGRQAERSAGPRPRQRPARHRAAGRRGAHRHRPGRHRPGRRRVRAAGGHAERQRRPQRVAGGRASAGGAGDDRQRAVRLLAAGDDARPRAGRRWPRRRGPRLRGGDDVGDPDGVGHEGRGARAPASRDLRRAVRGDDAVPGRRPDRQRTGGSAASTPRCSASAPRTWRRRPGPRGASTARSFPSPVSSATRACGRRRWRRWPGCAPTSPTRTPCTPPGPPRRSPTVRPPCC